MRGEEDKMNGRDGCVGMRGGECGCVGSGGLVSADELDADASSAGAVEVHEEDALPLPRPPGPAGRGEVESEMAPLLINGPVSIGPDGRWPTCPGC